MPRPFDAEAPVARARRAPTLLLVALVVLFAVLTEMSWQRWGHVRADCGGSLERAARLAEGAVLYRDVRSPYGPLGDYIVAGLFRLFGIHLAVATTLGLGLLAAQSCLLWRIATRVCPPVVRAVGLAGFWILFGFAPGLFGWVLPNTFASTFGAFFATATLALLLADLERPRPRTLVAASLCAAAAGLSKVEFGAAAAAIVMLCPLLFPAPGRGRGHALALAVLPGLGAAAAVALGFAALVPARDLLLDNVYRVRSFRASVLKLDEIPPPLGRVLGQAVARYGVELPLRAVLVAGALGVAARRGARRVAGALLAAVALLVPLAPGYPPLPDFLIISAATAFAWTPAIWALVLVLALAGSRRPGGRALFLLAVLQVGLAARWKLRLLWPSYYGFAAPLLVPLIGAAVAARAVRRRTALAAALVVAVPVTLLGLANATHYAAHDFVLSYPRGTMRTLPAEGQPMKATIDYVLAHTTPGEPVAVIPEERLINFFAERPHPGSEPGFGPGWLATPADEERFIHDLEASRTRLVVVSNRQYPEFGAGTFNTYNPRVWAYLQETYAPVWTSSLGAVRYAVYERRTSRP